MNIFERFWHEFLSALEAWLRHCKPKPHHDHIKRVDFTLV